MLRLGHLEKQQYINKILLDFPHFVLQLCFAAHPPYMLSSRYGHYAAVGLSLSRRRPQAPDAYRRFKRAVLSELCPRASRRIGRGLESGGRGMWFAHPARPHSLVPGARATQAPLMAVVFTNLI